MSVRTMLPVRRILINELCQRWVDRASRPHYREMLQKLSHESLVETIYAEHRATGREKARPGITRRHGVHRPVIKFVTGPREVRDFAELRFREGDER